MRTVNYIQKYQKNNYSTKIDFKPLDDGDALLLTGRYRGMKLSDIYIIDPNFFELLIKNDRVDENLKYIAMSIRKDGNIFANNISREIALK